LEADALRYLNRFDATTSKLSQKLEQRVRTVFGLDNNAPEWDEVREHIASLIARLSDAGVLNDLRLAEQQITSLRAKGKSRRAVDARLRVAGLHSHTIDQALGNVDSDPREADLNAAVRLVSRRKLGWCRPEPLRLANRQKDLARLGRAGFSHAVAVRALAGPLEDS
jgi:regulatory protein